MRQPRTREQQIVVASACLEQCFRESSNSIVQALSQHSEYGLTEKGREQVHQVTEMLNDLRREIV